MTPLFESPPGQLRCRIAPHLRIPIGPGPRIDDAWRGLVESLAKIHVRNITTNHRQIIRRGMSHHIGHETDRISQCIRRRVEPDNSTCQGLGLGIDRQVFHRSQSSSRICRYLAMSGIHHLAGGDVLDQLCEYDRVAGQGKRLIAMARAPAIDCRLGLPAESQRRRGLGRAPTTSRAGHVASGAMALSRPWSWRGPACLEGRRWPEALRG
jgi:hypothetical protein